MSDTAYADASAAPGHHRQAVTIIVAAMGLLICMNGPAVFVSTHLLDQAINFEYPTFLYPFVGVGVCGVVGLARTMPLRLGAWPWPLLVAGVYGLWAAASAMWSVAPSLTSVRALVTIGLIAFGGWFALEFTLREQIAALVVATSVAAAASAIVIAGWPHVGHDQLDGFWIGIFSNRNSLAPVCALGVIAGVGLAVEWRTRTARAVAVGCCVLNLVLMKGAESSSALVALLAAAATCGVMAGLRVLRRRGVHGALPTILGVAVIIFGWLAIFSNFSWVTRLTGKNTELSGRRLIWADVRRAISSHPVRGHGYWAYWERADLTANTYAHLGYPYGSAHNSMLEVTLGLGGVGAVLYSAVTIAAVGGVLRWAWLSSSTAAGLWTAVTIFVVAENLTESFVLWYSYNFVLFVAAATVYFGRAARGSGRNPTLPVGSKR